MGKHQIRLLLLSAASIALLVGALFAIPWFRIDFGLIRISIDMQSAQMCATEQGCRTIGFGRMTGFYPTMTTAAFWSALPLALLVIVQCTAKLLTGSASAVGARIGYVLGIIAFFAAFCAGFLFAPEMTGMQEIVNVVVERTAAPSMLLAGTLLGTIALRYAVHAGYDDSSGVYKPIVLAKGDSGQRLPVTPLHVKPVQGRAPTAPVEENTKPPTVVDRWSGPGTDVEGTKPTIPERRPRAATDNEHTTSPGGRAKTSSQQPLEARTKPASQPPLEARTKSGSQPPLEARTKSPSRPPEARTKSGSQPPLVARTSSPAHERTKPPSEPPIDLPERARTSSSGPIDLAARLQGAPINVAIKSPRPEPIPVPPDQIPVAPESGLVIRKRTQSAGPISPDQIPVAPESGLVIRKKSPSSVPLPEGGVPATLRGVLKYTVTLASITSEGINAHHEDGTTRFVQWDAIVGIIARRLPEDAPYDGSTFVDLISTAGATLRILPWTIIAGAPVHGEGEERARVFVQLVAARCLDAKLDSWTKVFGDGAGRPAQLPNPKTLDAHDARLA